MASFIHKYQEDVPGKDFTVTTLHRLFMIQQALDISNIDSEYRNLTAVRA